MEQAKVAERGFMASNVHKSKKLKPKNLKKIYENKVAVLNSFRERYR